MHNCPPAGKWAISVWEGPGGTAAGDALALCGPDAVDAAYSLDAQTGAWSRWFAGKPDVSNLPPLDDMQGVLAMGSSTAAATSEQTPTGAQASNELQHCPPPDKWSMAVWDGASGTAADAALATCGSGAVTAAYSLDPQTGAWSRWFTGKPDVSNLPPLDNMQGIIALGSGGGFSLSVDKFGEGAVTSSPSGIDCRADCTLQSATFPSGTSVALTATADPGSIFSHWTGCDSVSGNTCTVTLESDKKVFAAFALAELKLAEGAKLLDAETLQYLLRREDSLYYFDPAAEAAAALQPGDVILSLQDAGLVRRVIAVTVGQEAIVVDTGPASLGEAIEEGTIGVSLVGTSGAVASLRAASAAGSCKHAFGPWGNAIGLDIRDKSGQARGRLEGDLNVAGEWEACITMHHFSPREVRMVLALDPSIAVSISATAGVEKAPLDWTVAAFPPVCVPGVCEELKVKLRLSLEAEAGARGEVTLDMHAAAGFHWRQGDGLWPNQIIGDFSADVTPSLSPELSLEARLEPVFESNLLIFDVAGPRISVGPYARLEGAPFEVPWGRAFLGIGGQIDLVLQIPVLGIDVLKFNVAPFAAIAERQVWQSPTAHLWVNKNGSGTVSSAPAGIDCGPDCDELYNGPPWAPAVVSLTANPDPGWKLSSWSGCDSVSGDTCTVTMTSDRSVTASFEIPPATLSVALSAKPSSGTAPLKGVDLKADVSGTATGSINYTFYCNRADTGTNVTSGWAAKFDGVLTDPKTVVDACDYPASGTYTAKVIVERQNAPSAEARTSIVVSKPTLTPSPTPAATSTATRTPTPGPTATPNPDIRTGTGVVGDTQVFNFGTGDIEYSHAKTDLNGGGTGYLYGEPDPGSNTNPRVYFGDVINAPSPCAVNYDGYQGVPHIWDFAGVDGHVFTSVHAIIVGDLQSGCYQGILLFRQGDLYGGLKIVDIDDQGQLHYEYWYDVGGGSDFSSLAP